MVEFRHDLRSAIVARAVQECSHFLDGSVAHRANRRFFNGFCIRRFDCNAHDLGDDVIAAPDEHFITDFDFLFEYVAVVVERCARHGDSAYVNGL